MRLGPESFHGFCGRRFRIKAWKRCEKTTMTIRAGGLQAAGSDAGGGVLVYREPALGRPLKLDAKINQIEGTIAGAMLRRTRLVPYAPPYDHFGV
jgi:hypothetical protein